MQTDRQTLSDSEVKRKVKFNCSGGTHVGAGALIFRLGESVCLRKKVRKIELKVHTHTHRIFCL